MTEKTKHVLSLHPGLNTPSDLLELLEKAVEDFNNMTAEEQEAMMAEQRASWARQDLD